jgi:hypothetical protein
MSPSHQPFLHDLITVVAAPTQVLSQRTGVIASSVDRPTVQGMIHADVRVLSGLSVTVDGAPGEHLATTSTVIKRNSPSCCPVSGPISKAPQINSCGWTGSASSMLASWPKRS